MKKIIDFSTNFDSILWNQFQEFVATTNDDLTDNYIGLDPRDFASFPAVVVDDRIVCFSALQIKDEWWAKGIGRCSTRMWIHPEFRHGLSKFGGGSKYLNTTHCLPIQIAQAKLLGLDCLFISREHNPVAFKKYADLIKINCGIEFTMESYKYNVCGLVEDVSDSCQQWVMVHYLTPSGPALWYNAMSQYIM
jgi:hypothetical protein